MHYFPTFIIWHDTVIFVMWYISTLLSYVVSPNEKRKEKEKKRNINNDLAILPSHDTTPMFGYSHFWYPTPQYLKYFTSPSTFSCHLTSTSPLSLHCIILTANISYLFWDFSFFSFSPFFVLQLQARCLNFLQLQHSLSCLPSSCTLSEARAHFSVSMLLRSLLYCYRDIV